MPTFEWKGRGRTGDQAGTLVADSKDAVIASLRRQQIVVTAVKEKGKELAVPKFGGKVPPQLIAIFTRQFSVMIDAGLPLVQCLEILGSQQESKVFKKALYREYTDETFTTLKPRPKQWEHLGYLGPLVRAEVGDTIKIVFKNNLTFPASLHPHGVFYEKASEGAPYGDGVEPAKKSAAPHGGTQTYTWPVPERAGPTEHETSSVLWMYHSHVSEVSDANAGLMGPMIITRKGKNKSDGSPTDTRLGPYRVTMPVRTSSAACRAVMSEMPMNAFGVAAIRSKSSSGITCAEP